MGSAGIDTAVDVSSMPPLHIGSTYSGPTGWLATGGTFTPPATTPPTIPDPAGFAAAVLADTGITSSVQLLVANWEPSLAAAVAANNAPLISQVWGLLVSEYSISSNDQAIIAALASAYGIPGL